MRSRFTTDITLINSEPATFLATKEIHIVQSQFGPKKWRGRLAAHIRVSRARVSNLPPRAMLGTIIKKGCNV